MVDSAPELRFTRRPRRRRRRCARSPGRTRAAGGVRAEEPGRRDAGRAAQAVRCDAVGDREQRLDPRVGAVGDLGAVDRVGSRPLSGPPAVSRYGVNVAGVATAAPEQATRRRAPSDGAASAAGHLRPQACQSPRDRAHGSIAPNGQLRACRRRPSPRCRRRAAQRVRAARRRPPASTYAARPSTASAVASAPSTISQAGRPHAVDGLECAVARRAPGGRSAAIARSSRSAQEGGELRVAVAERGVALAERPDGAGQPVRRAAVGRVRAAPRVALGFSVPSGCIQSTTLPALRAGRRLQVGQAAQQLVRLRPGCCRARSAASAAGRRRRRGRCRRR